MKKNQIKFIGVCAAALMTVAAVAPVTTHAEGEAGVGVSTLASTYTENNLKPSVEMKVATFKNDLSAVLGALNSSVDVSQKTVDAAGWKELFNQPAVTAAGAPISLNLGLKNLDIDSTGKINQPDKKGVSQILVQSDYQPVKPGGYSAGDKITITFIGADAAGDQVGEPLATTVITLVAEKEKFGAVAQDITAAVGDEYNIQNGVTVTNKENGKALTFIDLTASGVTPTEGKVKVGGKEYKPGEWFTIADKTLKDGSANIFNNATATPESDRRVEEVTNPSNGVKTLKYKKGLKFNQTLEIKVPAKDAADEVTFYVNRTINVVDSSQVNPVPVYRAYNTNDGDHLFTTDQSEYNNVVAVGWSAENVAWNAASSTADNGFIVYRLYNPNSGEHFYTSSKAEYMNLGSAGWKQEGLGFNSPKAEGNVAVYRAFNPNAKGPGSHMFTTSKVEYDNMVKAGWTGEKIAFYGLAD